MKMELWVRSQDRECLLKTDIVMLEEIEENKEYWIYAGHEKYEPYTVFGIYHTKERALEVLDEIQNILKPRFIVDTSSINFDGKPYEQKGVILQDCNANVKIEEFSTFVYEMPKE